MTRALVVLTVTDNAIYWVLNLIGASEGGQSLMRQLADNPPELVRSDTVVIPIGDNDPEVTALVAAEQSGSKAVS